MKQESPPVRLDQAAEEPVTKMPDNVGAAAESADPHYAGCLQSPGRRACAAQRALAAIPPKGNR